MIQITAVTDTFLKKTPEQSSALSATQKVAVPAKKQYSATLLESDGLHAKYKLDYGAGDWWIFLPHWQIGDSQPHKSDGDATMIFQMKLAKSKQLIYGELIFSRGNKRIFSVRATSGVAGYQYLGAHTVRGRGLIPPGNHWRINLPGYFLSTKGIEGFFYHITPDPYAGRSEIGLHRDANVPGSAGCIVVASSQEFNDIVCKNLNQYNKDIALSVYYDTAS